MGYVDDLKRPLYRKAGDRITQSDLNSLNAALFCGWAPPSGVERKADGKWLASDYNAMIGFWINKAHDLGLDQEEKVPEYGD